MTNITVIFQQIFLEFKHLSMNIENDILSELKRSICGTCNKEYGYIQEVVNIINFGEGVVSSISPHIIFTIKASISCLKPQEGKEFKTTIFKVFSGGIFSSYNNISIFIPISELHLWKYIEKSEHYIKGKETLSVGDELDVIITYVKYSNKKYSCIGTLRV